MHRRSNTRLPLTRRLIIIAGSILLVYPFLRFISHRVPRKPVTIKVSEPLKQDHFLAHEDFFIFSEADHVWAVSRTCTHLGCRLQYKEQEDILECPCHQSRFSTSGRVINGPSQTELKRYPVEKITDPPAFIVTT
jgi:cytochrome b6-f complex iron-sulfur subunit